MGIFESTHIEGYRGKKWLEAGNRIVDSYSKLPAEGIWRRSGGVTQEWILYLDAD